MAKIVLIIAAIVEIVFRGLPAFFACEPIANFFDLEYIEGALPYVHGFGAVMLCIGILFIIASKNPQRNKLVIDIGILRYSLGSVAHLITFVMMGSFHIFWQIHMAVNIVLLILLFISRKQIST